MNDCILKTRKLLKENKIKQIRFADYINYTPPGLSRAFKEKKNQRMFYLCALVMCLERKGFDLEKMLREYKPSLLKRFGRAIKGVLFNF